MELGPDYHDLNMIHLGVYNQAGSYGVVDNMNDYIATYMIPELSRKDKGLRLVGSISISETIRRLIALKSDNADRED